MNNLVINEELFNGFCEHLSASLNVVDVLYKIRQLNSGIDLNRDDPILLAVFEPKMIQQLIALEYPEFIVACIRNFRLLEKCADVFLSELDTKMFDFFVEALQHLTQTAWIENSDRGFIVHSSALIADLLMSPIGRVHHEVMLSLDNFTRLLEVLENDPTRMFLNAKSPTPESQYIQIWISHKLGIPGTIPRGIMGVI